MDPNLEADVVATLHKHLAAWAGTWADQTLREFMEGAPPKFDAPVIAHLATHRAAVGAWLGAHLDDDVAKPRTFAERPAAYLVMATKRWLQEKNQFLDLGADVTEELSDMIQEALAEARDALADNASGAGMTKPLAAIVAALHGGIVEVVTNLGYVGAKAGEAPAIRGVVCSEYTPELQLNVMGLTPRTLAEPILDLGAGREARLVRYLRGLGKDAVGIDRVADHDGVVLEGDWMDFPLAPNKYGTVISHLGFTHHFHHHHLRGGDTPLRYAQRYMEILRSLKPGGVFAYAPGLPFIEELLPAEAYTVTRHEVPGLEFGGLYAARVTRTSAG